MKKVIAIMLSFVLMLTITACGGESKYTEYELFKISIKINETGEELVGADEMFIDSAIDSLKVDIDNLKLEYNDGDVTYRANLKAESKKDLDNGIYTIEWETPPVMEDWDIFVSYFAVLDNGYVLMGDGLQRSGYEDLLLLTLWSEK